DDEHTTPTHTQPHTHTQRAHPHSLPLHTQTHTHTLTHTQRAHTHSLTLHTLTHTHTHTHRHTHTHTHRPAFPMGKIKEEKELYENKTLRTFLPQEADLLRDAV